MMQVKNFEMILLSFLAITFTHVTFRKLTKREIAFWKAFNLFNENL